MVTRPSRLALASGTVFAVPLVFRLAPTARECRAMLKELGERVDHAAVWEILAVPQRTVDNWTYGYRIPAAAARKLIWVAWALHCYPERCRTVHDFVTWGRLADRRPPGRLTHKITYPIDGSDWVI